MKKTAWIFACLVVAVWACCSFVDSSPLAVRIYNATNQVIEGQIVLDDEVYQMPAIKPQDADFVRLKGVSRGQNRLAFKSMRHPSGHPSAWQCQFLGDKPSGQKGSCAHQFSVLAVVLTPQRATCQLECAESN